jgi:hypothetical protein
MRVSADARTYAELQGVPETVTPESIAEMRATDFQAGVNHGRAVAELLRKLEPKRAPVPVRQTPPATARLMLPGETPLPFEPVEHDDDHGDDEAERS